jgi:RHS repeat-associated protein
MRQVSIALRVLFLCLVTLPFTYAQNAPPGVASTFVPVPGVGHDYIKALTETVDPASGSVSLRISVPIPKGRGLTLPFNFAYDTNGIYVPYSLITPFIEGFSVGLMSQGGWSYTIPAAADTLAHYTEGTNGIIVPNGTNVPNTTSVNCPYYTNFRFLDPNGGRHGLGLAVITGTSPCMNYSYLTGSDISYQASLSLVAGMPGPLLVVDADGTTYSWPTGLLAKIEDRNGNVVQIQPTTGGGFNETDTAGRTVLSASGFGTSGNTVTVSGLGSPYSLNWGSASYNYTTTWTLLYHQHIQIACNSPSQLSGTLTGVVQSITIPNGQQYTFQYDPTYGLLSQITYPSGAWVKYTWAVNAQAATDYFPDAAGDANACEWRYGRVALASRTVSFDGVHTALSQTFQYSTTWDGDQVSWINKQTTVTTNDVVRGNSFTTTYVYSGAASGEPLPYYVNSSAIADTNVPVEQTVTYNDINGQTLKTETKSWYNAQQLKSEQVSLNGTPPSMKTYTYGTGGVLTEEDDYDFGATTPLRKKVVNYQAFGTTPLFSKPSIFDRPCQTIIYDSTGTNRVAETDALYDGGTSVCGTAGTPSVAGVSGMPSGTHDETNYGSSSTAPRGNATTVTSQCFQNGQTCASGNPATTYAFDETGQPLSMTDPRSNISKYSYADSYTSGTPPGNTNAYVTQITYPPTAGVAHIENFSYGYADGQLTQSKDQNSQVTAYKYNDSFDRLTETDYPDGGQTNLTYNDVPPTPTITTSKKLNASQTVTSVSIKDGLGHVTQTQLTSDPQGTVYTLATYDGLGRTYKAYNPYRSTSDSTYGFTTYNYDSLNRTTTVTDPDGSLIQTQYCGPSTLVTDAASHWRRSRTDGLGRLVEVDEPNSTTATVNVCPGSNEPIWVTSYTYDTLDDLIGVVQGGSRQRTFAYDSLKRLTNSTNPESNASGTATLYAYDANGNVTSKTDARGLVTNYSPSGSPIDPLNRVTSVTYSDGTPTVNYTYDQSACLGATNCYNIGHRTTMTDGGGSENQSYDPLGRELVEQRTSNSIANTTKYAYDIGGDLLTLTYPSGRAITYTYDAAGRPSTAKDVANGINYAVGSCLNSGACYAPQRALSQIQNGTNLVSTYIYNDRLQPCWLYVTTGSSLATNTACTGSSAAGNILDLKYNFNLGAGDNGNVWGVTNNRDTTRTQSFTYDQVNRIATAKTSATTGPNCWGETYTIDQWANLTAIGGLSGYTGCTQESLSVLATTNNQLSATGISYDPSGNMLTDGLNTYSYNAESEIKSAAGVNYTYDGDGNRLEKSNGKIYWYGAGTEILDESDLNGNFTGEYVFFGGKRVARRDVASGNIFYYADDMLGSSRTIVQAGQTAPCYDADFYPYGGERDIVNTCPQNYKFEGKERDTETNNDDFGARYYSWRFGRWLSVDWSSVPAPVPYANLANPQTLNLYAMVSDDPESFADLDGHTCSTAGPGSGNVPDSPTTCAGPQEEKQPGETTQAERQEAAQPPPAQKQSAGQTQNNSSKGPGLVGGLKNLLSGKTWDGSTDREPSKIVAAVADAISVGADMAHNAKLGVLSTIASVVNDPSLPNAAIAGVGLAPGVGEAATPLTIVGYAGYGVGLIVTDKVLVPMVNRIPSTDGTIHYGDGSNLTIHNAYNDELP